MTDDSESESKGSSKGASKEASKSASKDAPAGSLGTVGVVEAVPVAKAVNGAQAAQGAEKTLEGKPQQKSARSLLFLLRWYLAFFRGDERRVALGIVLSLLQSVALIPIPLFFRKIIDRDLPARDLRGLMFSGGAAVVLYFLHAIFAHNGRACTLLATKRVTEMLRGRLCMQLQQMSLRFYDRERASELHSRVVLDTENIDIMGNAVIINGFVPAITFAFASAVLAWLNPLLFIVALAFLPAYWLAHRRLNPRLHEVHRTFRKEMEAMSSQMNDLLQTIRLVKTFAREEHEQERAEDRFRTVTRGALDMTIYGSYYQQFMEFLSNLAIAALYVAGGMFIIQKKMTIGDLVAFTGMMGFLLGPLNTFLGMLAQVYRGLAALGPVHTLMTNNEPVEQCEGKAVVRDLTGRIVFENVTFSYEGTGRHALREVSTEVRPGETVALVGESGAGKSTFASLILGFYFPDTGRVLLDGQDTRALNLRTLREKIGVVSQENVLLNTSIRANLLYGRMNATEAEMIEAARRANALDFIERTAGGFDAVVGDRGVRLSGGQRQRLAIARAFLKNPRILILDEATSALDSESESKIQVALEGLRANRTCFIIAHRLSTVMSADRILVFRDGRIAEEGRHEELLKRGGEYARLARRQFRPNPPAAPNTAPPAASSSAA